MFINTFGNLLRRGGQLHRPILGNSLISIFIAGLKNLHFALHGPWSSQGLRSQWSQSLSWLLLSAFPGLAMIIIGGGGVGGSGCCNSVVVVLVVLLLPLMVMMVVPW